MALSPTGVVYSSGFVVHFDTVPNVLLDGCMIEATRQQACILTGSSSGAPTIKDSTIIISAGTTFIPNQGQAAAFQDAHIHNLTVIDAIVTNIPAHGIFIYVPHGTNLRFSGTNNCISASGKVKWISWSPGAGGATGILGENNGADVPKTSLAIGKTGGNNLIGYYGKMTIVAFSEAPTTGSWVVGDRCINSNPVVGQPKSWACTVAGTPGTWVSEGNL